MMIIPDEWSADVPTFVYLGLLPAVLAVSWLVVLSRSGRIPGWFLPAALAACAGSFFLALAAEHTVFASDGGRFEDTPTVFFLNAVTGAVCWLVLALLTVVVALTTAVGRRVSR